MRQCFYYKGAFWWWKWSSPNLKLTRCLSRLMSFILRRYLALVIRWPGRQVFGVSSDILVRQASGLDVHCVKKHCGLVGLCFGGRVALDLRLSRVLTGVAAMKQDCNYYYLDTTKLGWKINKTWVVRQWLEKVIQEKHCFLPYAGHHSQVII
jgi:hypothetical protein